MAEKQYKPLNEGNLHQNVAETNRHEIKNGNRRGSSPAAVEGERQNQKQANGNRGDRQDEEQHENSEIHFPVNPGPQALLAENLAGLQREKEEGRIVVYRSNIVGIRCGKRVRIIARNQVGKRILPWRRWQVQRLESRIPGAVCAYRIFFR